MSNASEFTTRLLNGFPNATDDDVRLCWDLTKAYDESVHAAAIDEHRLDQGGKIWRPDPRALATICRRLAPADAPRQPAGPRVDSPFVERTTAYLQQSRAADAAAEADAARVDGIIAGIADEELERHKAAVLDASNDFVRRCLAGKDPRADRRLKSLIVARLEGKGSVAA